jgi:hypothetical protein
VPGRCCCCCCCFSTFLDVSKFYISHFELHQLPHLDPPPGPAAAALPTATSRCRTCRARPAARPAATWGGRYESPWRGRGRGPGGQAIHMHAGRDFSLGRKHCAATVVHSFRVDVEGEVERCREASRPQLSSQITHTHTHMNAVQCLPMPYSPEPGASHTCHPPLPLPHPFPCTTSSCPAFTPFINPQPLRNTVAIIL